MHYTSLFLAVAALSSSVSAQDIQAVDPGSVEASTRASWCDAQRNTCPQICVNGTTANTCDPALLTYSCLCSSGATPNITNYEQTLPFFLCQTQVAQCIERTDDAAEQRECQNLVCGSENAASLAPSTTSSSSRSSSTSSATMTPTASETSASTAATTPTSTGAAVPLYASHEYGTPALIAGMLAVFGFAI